MEPSPAGGRLEELAYELGYRALVQQEGSVDELRARTGVLLAAAALVASFLGTAVIDEAGLGFVSTLALLAFVGSVLPSLYILWPKAALIFAVRGTVLFEEEFGGPGGLPETHRRLAYWLEGYREATRSLSNGSSAHFAWLRCRSSVKSFCGRWVSGVSSGNGREASCTAAASGTTAQSRNP